MAVSGSHFAVGTRWEIIQENVKKTLPIPILVCYRQAVHLFRGGGELVSEISLPGDFLPLRIFIGDDFLVVLASKQVGQYAYFHENKFHLKCTFFRVTLIQSAEC